MTTPSNPRTELVAHATQTIEATGRGLQLRSIEDYWRFSQAVQKSGMAPKSLNSPEKVMIALQMGAEVGLTPMQSLANIAVVNGRAVMWGDALVALVRCSPLCESIRETWEGEGERRVANCFVKRRGQPEECRRFGYADAKRAGLLSRDTYKSYLDRMLQCRARAWAIRDVFSDLLMGLAVAEEAQDEQFAETTRANITSGDAAPLDSLDDAAELLSADERARDADDGVNPVERAEEARGPAATVTAEEAAEWELRGGF